MSLEGLGRRTETPAAKKSKERFKGTPKGAWNPAMSRKLKLGDRVRVTWKSRVVGYSPGDKGTVRAGPMILHGQALTFYLVMMDRDDQPRAIPFNADEVEPDT
jgi:hypothetical protein